MCNPLRPSAKCRLLKGGKDLNCELNWSISEFSVERTVLVFIGPVLSLTEYLFTLLWKQEPELQKQDLYRGKVNKRE